jgi:hypothetical protein
MKIFERIGTVIIGVNEPIKGTPRLTKGVLYRKFDIEKPEFLNVEIHFNVDVILYNHDKRQTLIYNKVVNLSPEVTFYDCFIDHLHAIFEKLTINDTHFDVFVRYEASDDIFLYNQDFIKESNDIYDMLINDVYLED